MSEFELIEDLDGIAEVESEWRKLAVDRGNAFITPEWFRAWFRHYGKGHTPLVLVSRREDGSIEGVLPLVASANGRVKRLRFAGANLGDYFEPAARIEDDDRVAVAAAQALSDRYQRRYLLTLDRVSIDAAWPSFFANRENSGHRMTRVGSEDVLPYLPIRGATWSEYLSSRSKNTRHILKKKSAALERDYDFRFRTTADPAEVERDMDALFHLHDRRWSTRGGSSLASTVARAFLKDFAALALQNEWLRLVFLEIDGVPVAAELDWRLGSRHSCYQAGFDPKFSHYSVG